MFSLTPKLIQAGQPDLSDLAELDRRWLQAPEDMTRNVKVFQCVGCAPAK
jgi:hypothetical protein